MTTVSDTEGGDFGIPASMRARLERLPGRCEVGLHVP